MLDKGPITTTGCNVLPIWWDGILWVDENHIRQVIGGNGHDSSFSSKQYLIAMDPNTGEHKPLAKGGKMPMRKQKTVPKYPQEARACYGIAVPTVRDEPRPAMIQPWSYTGKKLISYKMWKQKVNQENESKRKSQRKEWKNLNSNNPYKERYGEDHWEEEIAKSTALKPFTSVHHLFLHLVGEGNCIFKDTKRADTWMLYHDHLKIFWEKDTIEFIKNRPCPAAEQPTRTWYDCRIKIVGKENN